MKERKMRLYMDGRREAYDPTDIRHTMTVGELIELLQGFDEDAKVYISNDNGYTYGSVTEDSFTEDSFTEDSEGEEDEEDEETDL